MAPRRKRSKPTPAVGRGQTNIGAYFSRSPGPVTAAAARAAAKPPAMPRDDEDECGTSVSPPQPVARAGGGAEGGGRRLDFDDESERKKRVVVQDDDETDGEVEDLLGAVEERMTRGGRASLLNPVGREEVEEEDVLAVEEGGDEAFLSAEDVPMTQEEEEVNVHLKSLNCSQDASPAPASLSVEEDLEMNAVPVAAAAAKNGENVVANKRPQEDAAKCGGFDDTSPAPAAKVSSPYGGSVAMDVDTAASAATLAPAAVSSSSDFDSGDDAELMAPVVLPSRRTTRLAAAPARFDPSASGGGMARGAAAGGSVFAGIRGDAGPRRRPAVRRPAAAPTAVLRRKHDRHVERERELAALREEVLLAENGVGEGAGEVAAEEAKFREMAVAQEKARAAAEASYDRFERPPSLFTRGIEILERDEQLWGMAVAGGKRYGTELLPLHPLHQVLSDAAEQAKVSGVDIGMLLSASLMKWTVDETNGVDVGHESSDVLVEMLWQLVAHDKTPCGRRCGAGFEGAGDRVDIFLMLVHLVARSDRSSRALPPIRCLLSAYGADFDGAMSASQAAADASERAAASSLAGASTVVGDEIHAKTAGMEPCSLDYQIVAVRDVDQQPESIVARAARNLRRAFRVYGEAVKAGMDLRWLVQTEGEAGQGLKKPRKVRSREWTEGDSNAAVRLLLTCGRVVISPFGSELCREVGGVITYVLERVPEALWPAFRWRAAKALVNLSDRLVVQVGLATHDLPYLTTRSRCLQLDFTYLCLAQWCPGPADGPSPVDISSMKPGSAKSDCTSFGLSDVTVLLASIPELGKDTVGAWAFGMGQLVKQVLSDTDVILTRMPQDITGLVDRLKLLRKLSRRAGGSVPIQKYRLAIDTTLNVLHGHADTDIQARRELKSHMVNQKTQQTLSDMFNVKP